MDINVIINLVSGLIGGNIAGAAVPDKSLGVLGNSISGLVGGGIGAFIMQAFGLLAHAQTAAGGGVDIASLISNVGSGGVSGAVLMLIIAFIKGSLQKSA